MGTGDDAAIPSSQDQAAQPRLFEPLPGRIVDTSAIYERILTDLIALLGETVPALVSGTRRSRRNWQHRMRRVVEQAMGRQSAREELFEPLVRAAIYEPDPSFNQQLVEPAMAAFGRRRVMLALLDYLGNGSNPERAGAANAWYWTLPSLVYIGGSRTPTPESVANARQYNDLLRRWHETALRVFVADEDLDVRRCMLALIDMRVQAYPDELRETVEKAIHIARTSSDEYLRHRVEHQV
jgi:hypothetical protein